MKQLTTRQMRCEAVALDIEQSETFDMRYFAHNCGSPACIAGHIAARMPREDLIPMSFYARGDLVRYVGDTRHPMAGVDIQESAAAYFGLNEFQARRLFEPDAINTSGFDVAAQPRDKEFITNKKAAAVLRHYGRTGKVDWSVEPA